MYQFYNFLSILVFLNAVQIIINQSSDPQCKAKWPDCEIGDDKYVNTACARKDCGPRFKGCIELPPDPAFRRALLDKHNELRNKLASGADTRGSNEAASNMMALSYDLRLEYTAICHVHGCELKHDKCRGMKDFELAGQNLAKRKVTRLHVITQADVDEKVTIDAFKDLTGKWYEEIALNDFKSMIDSYTFDHPTGHFTALVWAETKLMGCARAIDRSHDKFFIIHLTCNYAPGGNVITLPIYKKGAACSKCPDGVSCNKKYTSLCGEINDTQVNTGPNPYRAADVERGKQSSVQPALASYCCISFHIFFVIVSALFK